MNKKTEQAWISGCGCDSSVSQAAEDEAASSAQIASPCCAGERNRSSIPEAKRKETDNAKAGRPEEEPCQSQIESCGY